MNAKRLNRPLPAPTTGAVFIPIRHSCSQRLFDSRFTVIHVADGLADITRACPRCRRRTGQRVLTGYTFRLPRWKPTQAPTPFRCSNLACMARLADLGLPNIRVRHQNEADVVIKCEKCKTMNYLRLIGLAEVVRIGTKIDIIEREWYTDDEE